MSTFLLIPTTIHPNRRAIQHARRPCLHIIVIALCIFSLSAFSFSSLAFAATQSQLKAQLGSKLYFDQNLSLDRTQSCATCHNPVEGFVDKRELNEPSHKQLKQAVSLGDDQKSFGDRSAPSSAYANQTPLFHRNKDGEYVGGQFWDGRASSLADQAKGPPLNPIEMGMPNKEAMRIRLLENNDYRKHFESLYGAHALEDADLLYEAMADAIAAFEKTDFFSPFDSKYDRYLKGKYQLSSQEDLGMTLFFSQQFTNCNQCHQLKSAPTASNEPFSNYRYHNIGVPINTRVRQHNMSDENYRDIGLLANPDVSDEKHRGQFKTPSLRNVAVTAPYMHNGVFQELRTVVDFYNKYNSKNQKRQINPEKKRPWAKPEVAKNLSLKELESGPALDDKRINALVAFMRTLTDQRYEHLLNKD